MHNPKEKVLSLAIAIILVFFFIYGVNVFYREPSRMNYCSDEIYENIAINQSDCESLGGNWNYYQGVNQTSEDIELNGWCNPSYACDIDYDLAKVNYARTIFIIMVISF